ncbi:MAG TPA: site-2 protease family protein [Opitutus sp.]|nr:site-2 protease family protein [Opitutus sp.]
MLGWSLNLFRVRGIQLAVHASFFLLLAWVANEGWQTGQAGGLFWNTLTFLAFFACVVLHELGHSFTAMHFGIGVRRILLMPIGGMAEFDAIPRQPARELLITLAGPAVNFVLAAILWFFLPDLESVRTLYSPGGFIFQLWFANLVMGCFNLLPAFPMDGGRIFRAILAWRMPYLRATRYAATLGKIICVLGILAAVFIPAVGRHVSRLLLGVLFAFIYFAGEAEYRAVRRREIEDAHWREILAHAYGRPAQSEPPLLSR